MWVAEQGPDIIGCCGIFPTEGLADDCAELVKFYLPASARGNGIGKSLMNQCVESAKAMGYTQLYLESIPIFAKAVSMYEKQGFVRLDKPLGNSGHSTCSIWMVKTL
jgi:putative acetyltransferase